MMALGLANEKTGRGLEHLEKLQFAYTTRSCFKKYQADDSTMIISTPWLQLLVKCIYKFRI